MTMLFGTIALWSVVLIFEPKLEIGRPKPSDWGGMLAMGLLCSALPNTLIFVVIKRGGAVFASLYGYVMPVLGLVLAAIVFHITPSRTIYIGTPIAFAGMALLQWAQGRRRAGAG